MPSPFPGMDPYLENPVHWPGVHTFLIAVYAELLNRLLRPRYVARIEERVYMVPDDDPDHALIHRAPDVQIERPRRGAGKGRRVAGTSAIAEPVIVHQSDPIRESLVEIRKAAGQEIVTVIEVLSPSNKLNGAAGRASFIKKREEVLGSTVNWVEVDLLRAGIPHPVKKRFPRHQYLVYSSPTNLRPKGKVWPIPLQEQLPVIGIPLRESDPDAPLDLQAALTLAYDRGAYDVTADYTRDPVPPLPPDLSKWSNKLLRQKKLR